MDLVERIRGLGLRYLAAVSPSADCLICYDDKLRVYFQKWETNEDLQGISCGEAGKLMHTSRLCWLVLCILHTILFAKEKNENATKKDESSLADVYDVTSRDYIALFP